MAAVKKTPMRMCLACREMKPKKEMLRVVKNAEGEIFIDYKGKAMGRGAYICNSKTCVTKLCKHKLLNKNFSCVISLEIYKAIEEQYIDRQQN